MKEAVTRTRESLSERIEEVVSFGKEMTAPLWTILKLRSLARPGQHYYS